MPQTPPHLPPPTDRPRAGLLLVPAHRRTAPAIDPAAWHGLDPQRLAWLIEHYSHAGDIVLDTDNHPAVTDAAHYLHRRPRPEEPIGHQVALLLAGLPRPATTDLIQMTEAMRRWHHLLRPGGFLLTALKTTGTEHTPVSPRSNVVTAARAAGLRYHQHLPAVLVPLPETEPRTDPATAAHTRPALIDGRHAPIHLDVLAFAAGTVAPEATDA